MLSKSFLIFGIIGVINTAVDVVLFVTLHNVGLPILIANIISTTVALCVSFSLNARFTFKDSGRMTRQKVVRFLLVTLTGLWLLQPAIIGAVLYLINNVDFIRSSMEVFIQDSARFDTTIAKIASLPATLVWNFVLYKAIVFKTHAKPEEI